MTTPDNDAYMPSEEWNGTAAPDAIPARKHSKLGIASFIIGTASILAFIVCLVFFTLSIMDYVNADGKLSADAKAITGNAHLMLTLLLMFATVCTGFVGLVLGIVGACMKNTRKVFSVLGIILNGLLVVGFAGLAVLGILVRAAEGATV